jgi:predicted transcriptional regulator
MAPGIVTLRLRTDLVLPVDSKLIKLRNAVIATYTREGEMVDCFTEDKFLVYKFKISPAKVRKHKPLGYIPLNPLKTHSEHKPYYSWRVDTANACTCRKKGTTIREDNTPHPESYSTSSQKHSAGCKAQTVIKKGGFA